MVTEPVRAQECGRVSAATLRFSSRIFSGIGESTLDFEDRRACGTLSHCTSRRVGGTYNRQLIDIRVNTGTHCKIEVTVHGCRAVPTVNNGGFGALEVTTELK